MNVLLTALVAVIALLVLLLLFLLSASASLLLENVSGVPAGLFQTAAGLFLIFLLLLYIRRKASP